MALAPAVRRASGPRTGSGPRIRFQTVVFDLDGTLVDTAPDLAAAVNVALGTVGRPPLSLPAVRMMIGHGSRALLRKALAATGDADAALVDAAYPVLIDHYTAHICDLSRPYPGVEAAIDRLSACGIALSICTNKPLAPTLALIAALGWEARFASIVGGDTLPVSKPDPAPLQLAIDQSGGGAAAFVGDSITDTQTAIAAGLPCIAVSFGFADRPAADLGAHMVIDHFDDLIPALTRLGRLPS